MKLQTGFQGILNYSLEVLKAPKLHQDRVNTEQTVLLLSGAIRWGIRLEDASTCSPQMLSSASQALFEQRLVADAIRERLVASDLNRAAKNRAENNYVANNGAANNRATYNGGPKVSVINGEVYLHH